MTSAPRGDGGGTQLLGAGSAYAVATVAPILSALLVTPLVTRMLGQQQYGYVALFLVCNQLGQVAAGLGLPAAISRRVATRRGEVDRAVGTALLLTAFLVPVALGGVGVAILRSDAPAVVVVGLATASSCALASFTCAQAVSRGLAEVRVFVVQAISLSLGGPLAGFAAASLQGDSRHYMAGVLLVQTACVIQASARMWRSHGFSLVLPLVREDLRIGLPTVPHQFATVGSTAVLVLVSGQIGGASLAGEMQVVVLYGTAVLLVLGALNNSWAIQFYALPSSARATFLSHTTSLLVVVAATGGRAPHC